MSVMVMRVMVSVLVLVLVPVVVMRVWVNSGMARSCRGARHVAMVSTTVVPMAVMVPLQSFPFYGHGLLCQHNRTRQLLVHNLWHVLLLSARRFVAARQAFLHTNHHSPLHKGT
jgi:hypothetical protein